MYSEDPEPGTPTQGKVVRAEVTKIKFNRDGTSSATGSTQLSNQSMGQKKVVINYADLVKEQRKLEGENGADVAISDRNNSNLSIGYNHEPTSPMRQRSLNDNTSAGAWPDTNNAASATAASSQVKGAAQALFNEELEMNGDDMTFEQKNVAAGAADNNRGDN